MKYDSLRKLADLDATVDRIIKNPKRKSPHELRQDKHFKQVQDLLDFFDGSIEIQRQLDEIICKAVDVSIQDFQESRYWDDMKHTFSLNGFLMQIDSTISMIKSTPYIDQDFMKLITYYMGPSERFEINKDYLPYFKSQEFETVEEIVELGDIKVPGYEIIKRIGRGAIKIAYLARHISSEDDLVLLKIDPSCKGFLHYQEIHHLETQGESLKMIHEEEFATSKMFNRLEDTKYVGLVLYAVEGNEGKQSYFFLPTRRYEKTLEDVLQGYLRYDKAVKYLYQMAYALDNCHKEGIVHKDLKPDNIGITDRDNVLVTDFGSISMFSYTADSRYQYPADLKPPELAHPDKYWKEKGVEWQSELFTPEANVWTLGAIFYRMITGEPFIVRPTMRQEIGSPEWHEENLEMYEKIRDPNYLKERKMQLYDMRLVLGGVLEVAKLADMCLKIDPAERSGALNGIMFMSESILRDYNPDMPDQRRGG